MYITERSMCVYFRLLSAVTVAIWKLKIVLTGLAHSDGISPLHCLCCRRRKSSHCYSAVVTSDYARLLRLIAALCTFFTRHPDGPLAVDRWILNTTAVLLLLILLSHSKQGRRRKAAAMCLKGRVNALFSFHFKWIRAARNGGIGAVVPYLEGVALSFSLFSFLFPFYSYLQL